MSILGIDWNGDGNIDFTDTAVDAMLIEEMEENDDVSLFDNEEDD